jgi:hypothetical protein
VNQIKAEFQSLYNSRDQEVNRGRSENSLLESLIGNTSYISRELYTFFPVSALNQIATNKDLDERIINYAMSHQGQIITEHQQTNFDSKNIHTYATTGECGRVLEIPTEKISRLLKNSSIGTNLTMKGVGSTWYAREHGYRSPYIPDNQGIKTNLQEIHALRKISYYSSSGVLDLEDGLAEFNTSLKLIAEGVENVQVPVSLVGIKSMFSEDGQLIPLDHFKQNGTLGISENPVILSRLAGTNLRLMDLDVLNSLGYTDSMRKILVVMTKQFGKKYHRDKENFSEADYIIELLKKIVKNEMKIIMLGYSLMATHWQDMIRNMSLMGDRFDCEGVVFDGIFKPSDVESGSKDIIEAMCSMYSIFKKVCPDLELSTYHYTLIDTVTNEYNQSLGYIPKLREETSHYYISILSETNTKFGIFRSMLRVLVNIETKLFSSLQEKESLNIQVIELMQGKLGFNETMIGYIFRNNPTSTFRLDRDLNF